MSARPERGMRGAALLLCWLSVTSGERPELVFHVPDVSVRHEPAPDRAVGTGHSRSHQLEARTSAVRRDHAQPRRSLTQVEHHSEREPRDGSQPQRSVTQVEHLGDGDERHGGVHERHYEEYFVEHEISAVDARKAANTLRVQNIPERAPGCGVCSREEIAYCESHVVADHCCCERRFQEPYPWIPHSCYAGPRPCRPVARDCGFYRRLRDCCCDRRLAEKWKNILSSSIRALPSREVLLLPVLVVCLVSKFSL